MGTYEKIKNDIVALIKAKNKTQLGILRLVASKVEKSGDKTDAGALSAIKSEIKEMKQTLEALEKHGDGTLVDEQKNKIKFLETYLPAQLTVDEVRQLVTNVVETSKTIGAAMKAVKVEIEKSGKDVDMSIVSKIVKEEVNKSK